MSVVGITTKGNVEQAEAVRVLMDNQHPIVAITGDAGTGKTFITLATALELLCVEHKYGSILFARNPVQMGENIGYLPGNEEEKLRNFMSPLADNAKQIAAIGKQMSEKDILAKIQMIPIYALRGRTFENCFIIIDECQNFNITELKTILTRAGKYTKLVLLGSMNQIDEKHQNKKLCDFQRMINKLEEVEMPEFVHVHLVQSMRAPWCTYIDQVLSELEK